MYSGEMNIIIPCAETPPIRRLGHRKGGADLFKTQNYTFIPYKLPSSPGFISSSSLKSSVAIFNDHVIILIFGINGATSESNFENQL